SSLMQLEGVLGRACSACEGVYRVLHWENPALSSQFYGVLLGSLCVLYLLPLCWVLALINSALFLGNAHFCRGESPPRAPYTAASTPELTEPEAEGGGTLADWTPPPSSTEGGGTRADWTPTPTSTEVSRDLTPGSVEEAEEAEPDEEFKDAIEVRPQRRGGSCPCSADSDLPEGGAMSKNEVIRSKVSRLTERLGQRPPRHKLWRSCTGCTATFSVLKKRRSCSNCGNSFCSRCCSYKVPKSFMGATAPDAQREMVFVCALCNQALVK
uniref:Protrudin n=1 Tax=Pelodiscus sinensis TaxID=13735 RepID=K7FJ59_PELSI